MKVKYKISVSSDAEETLKYPYVQIKIEIRNRSRTTIPLIKGIHHPDTCTDRHCQTRQHKVFNSSTAAMHNGSTAPMLCAQFIFWTRIISCQFFLYICIIIYRYIESSSNYKNDALRGVESMTLYSTANTINIVPKEMILI